MSTALNVDSIGPIDVAVILFEGNEFNGDVAPALANLVDSGTIRVVDMAFVCKDEDGSSSFIEIEDAQVAEAFAAVGDEQFDLLSERDLLDAADGLKPDSSALLIVWENSWAAEFATAVRGSQGRVIAMERIPHADVLRAVAALDEE
jgi:hypothetical protein